jgi:hypothetical protein
MDKFTSKYIPKKNKTTIKTILIVPETSSVNTRYEPTININNRINAVKENRFIIL